MCLTGSGNHFKSRGTASNEKLTRPQSSLLSPLSVWVARRGECWEGRKRGRETTGSWVEKLCEAVFLRLFILHALRVVEWRSWRSFSDVWPLETRKAFSTGVFNRTCSEPVKTLVKVELLAMFTTLRRHKLTSRNARWTFEERKYDFVFIERYGSLKP